MPGRSVFLSIDSKHEVILEIALYATSMYKRPSSVRAFSPHSNNDLFALSQPTRCHFWRRKRSVNTFWNPLSLSWRQYQLDIFWSHHGLILVMTSFAPESCFLTWFWHQCHFVVSTANMVSFWRLRRMLGVHWDSSQQSHQCFKSYCRTAGIHSRASCTFLWTISSRCESLSVLTTVQSMLHIMSAGTFPSTVALQILEIIHSASQPYSSPITSSNDVGTQVASQSHLA